MEVSKLHCLAHRASVTATHLFAFPETDRRGTTLFRSHTIAALDDVDLIFWSYCRFDFRNARRANRFAQTRRARPRPRPAYARAGSRLRLTALQNSRRLSPAP